MNTKKSASAPNKKKTRKKRPRGKMRPPEHIRADMSFHHVAYMVVKSGFTIEETSKDYGYDATVDFFDASTGLEQGYVLIQLKATEDVANLLTSKGFSYSVDMRDFDLWAKSIFPVYFIIFDAKTETSHWIYFQKYVQANNLDSTTITTDTITIHIDPAARVHAGTPKIWQADKDKILAQIPQVQHV